MDHAAGFEDRALGPSSSATTTGCGRSTSICVRSGPGGCMPAGRPLPAIPTYGAALAGDWRRQLHPAGKPFERLVEDEIFMPLGMNHPTFREPHAAEGGPAGAHAGGPRWRARRPTATAGRSSVGFARRGLSSSSARSRLAGAGLLHSRGHGGALHADACSSGVAVWTASSIYEARSRHRPSAHRFGADAAGHRTAGRTASSSFDLPGGIRGYGHGVATSCRSSPGRAGWWRLP